MSGPPSPQLPLVVQAKNAEDAEDVDATRVARLLRCPSDLCSDDFGTTNVPDEGDSPIAGCLIRAPRSQSNPTPGTKFMRRKVTMDMSKAFNAKKLEMTDTREKRHSSSRREGSTTSAPCARTLSGEDSDASRSITPRRPRIRSMPAATRLTKPRGRSHMPVAQKDAVTATHTMLSCKDGTTAASPSSSPRTNSDLPTTQGFPFPFVSAFSARALTFTTTEDARPADTSTSPSIIERLFASVQAKTLPNLDEVESPKDDEKRRETTCAVSPRVADNTAIPSLSTAAQFLSAFLSGNVATPDVSAASEPSVDATKNDALLSHRSLPDTRERTHESFARHPHGETPSSSSTCSPTRPVKEVFVSADAMPESRSCAPSGGESPRGCATPTEPTTYACTDRSRHTEEMYSASPTTASTCKRQKEELQLPISPLNEFYTPEIPPAKASELIERTAATEDPAKSFQHLLSEVEEASCDSPPGSESSSPGRFASEPELGDTRGFSPNAIAAQHATRSFQARVRQIMKSDSTKDRQINVLLSGVLWKEERLKSMKSALGKMWDSSLWSSNMKKTVATTVKEAWHRKSDVQLPKMSLRTVELCNIQTKDGEPRAYLRWARVDPTAEPIETVLSPAPESLDALEKRCIHVKERPLLGSWVVDAGVRENGLHVMHIYFPWGTENSSREYPFATENAKQFREWFDALRAAGKCPEPTPEQYKQGIVSAKLNLEILSATHSSSAWDLAGSPTDASHSAEARRSTFCVVTFKDVCMRTPCVDSVMDDQGEEVSYWNHKTEIVIERDEPDDSLSVEVYDAPNYADSHATLVGKTNIPLWFFERRRHVELSVSLKNPDQLRRGVVPKTGPIMMNIRGYFDQPLRSVFLPLELPKRLTEEPADIDVVELQETIQRIEALIKIYDNFIELLKYMLFWDSKAYSFGWLTLITVWLIWIPEYTLTIILFLVSFYTVKYHWTCKARQFGGKFFLQDPDEMHLWTYFKLNPAPRRSNSSSESSAASPTEKQDEEEVPKTKTPDRLIYEHERRWPFTQFDPQYLFTDIDQPHYMDKNNKQSTQAPKSVMIDRDGVYSYRWEVHTTAETDENGWQYSMNASSTQWRSLYNSFDCFFRRRLHIGYRLQKTDPVLESEKEDDVCRPPLIKCDMSVNNLRCEEGENATSEADIIKQHKSVYCKIRNDVEITIRLIERYKNLFSGRLKWLTKALIIVLISASVLSLIIPTRWVVWYLIVDYFRWGWVAGKTRRSNINAFATMLRDEILRTSGEKSGSKGPTIASIDTVSSKKWDLNTPLNELKFDPLCLRNWINQKFKLKLSLKQLSGCKTLLELSRLVVFLSDHFIKYQPRVRASWWEKWFDNLLDHIPSDRCRFQLDNAAYSLD